MSTPTLVLIHGYPFEKSLWDEVVARLDPAIKTLVIDLPGFGSEPVSKETPSIDVYAQHLAKHLDLNQVQTAVIAGMSMGGYVALAFAEKFRERVAGLALINSQSFADTPEAREQRAALIEKIQAGGVQVAVEVIQPKMFNTEKQPDPKHVRKVAEGAAKAGVAGITWALQAMAKRPDRTHLLHDPPFPVLLLHGENDAIIPLSKIEKLVSSNRLVRLVKVPHAGHATPLETPAEIASALNRFVQEVRANSAKPKSNDPHAQTRPGIVWGPTEKGL